MKYIIRHESKKTLRIHTAGSRMSFDQADLLEYYLKSLSFVHDVSVFERTGDALIRCDMTNGNRDKLLSCLDKFSYDDESIMALVPEQTGRALNNAYQEKIILKVTGCVFRKIFFPIPLGILWSVIKSIKFFVEAVKCLLSAKLEVSVLDALAIGTSMLRGDFDTASSVMFWLEIGDTLEEWTHKKSVGDLARTMSLNVDKVWLKDGETEILVDIRSIKENDLIVVATSNIIPLDGVVADGEITVNQASMTGESVPVPKSVGGYVYAGTVVEDGECLIRVTKTLGTGRYDQIVKMIEESEKLKSDTETKAYHLADRLVPYSLLGSAATYLFTRNAAKALSFLMVDFSCALRLAMPLSVLSAIKEARGFNISVKGGKFLEAVASADTIVFDKTGTLTHSLPTVVDIVTFGGVSETEALRIAACLEEHYPHSIANAVVDEAKKRGIIHDEMHNEVQYVVAHGLSSSINGKKAVIGSYHFVFEDEKCTVPEGEQEKLDNIPDEYSHLYLAIGGKLTAVMCIFDPLRDEAEEVIRQLHSLGISKICMMTGDNLKTAKAVASSLSIDEFHANVLPEDKANFIIREHKLGRKVIMVGDGINDSPALSEADAGIAISEGAAIAREIADITISSDDLHALIDLRKISTALMSRISNNYRFILGFNSMLILMGVLGILPPASSALLHNTSTVITGLKSMTNLLDNDKNKI